jgi:hypothetical protein
MWNEEKNLKALTSNSFKANYNSKQHSEITQQIQDYNVNKFFLCILLCCPKITDKPRKLTHKNIHAFGKYEVSKSQNKHL